eukprot:5419941-Amphidinium_carterae.3
MMSSAPSKAQANVVIVDVVVPYLIFTKRFKLCRYQKLGHVLRIDLHCEWIHVLLPASNLLPKL